MDTQVTPRLRQLTSEAERESSQLETEMREIELLIRQTTGEIERLQQKQAEATSRVRTLEANLDSYKPEDIRNTYTSAQDAQMRLFMMRNQLEQLQTKQRTMQRFRSQLDKLGLLATQLAEESSFVATPENTDASDGSANRKAIINIIEAQESERQHLSRQMHDGPAQSLTNLILQAEIVERMFDSDPAKAKTELGNLKTSANTTFQRVRDFIFDLRPMMLDDLGLLPTLKRYVQTYEAKSRLPVNLVTQGERSLSQYLEVTLFRAVQELLNNAAEHAHASRVQVSLDLEDDPIVVTVEDDGSGFDVESVLSEVRQRGSSGLANLEKRIQMLGGRMQFQSGTGRGTKIRAELPAV
jgi:two-component system, NarL family, sensor histidine kinase DegS